MEYPLFLGEKNKMPKRIKCPKCPDSYSYADTLYKRKRIEGKIKLVAVGYQCNSCGFTHFDLKPTNISAQIPHPESTVTTEDLQKWYPTHIEVEYTSPEENGDAHEKIL